MQLQITKLTTDLFIPLNDDRLIHDVVVIEGLENVRHFGHQLRGVNGSDQLLERSQQISLFFLIALSQLQTPHSEQSFCPQHWFTAALVPGKLTSQNDDKSPAVARVSRPYSWCTLATCVHNCPSMMFQTCCCLHPKCKRSYLLIYITSDTS